MHRCVALLVLCGIVSACGGGGGGGATPVTVPAPSGLSYTSPVDATVGTAVSGLTPTVTGTVSSYSVSPALPSGLSISATSGAVTGTPTAVTPMANYTVTATNSSGSTTFALSITVRMAAPSGFGYKDALNHAVTSAGVVATQGVPISPITPTITGSVDTYSVNPALPSGLFLDTASGTISGTPKNTQTIAVYTVSATNAGGTATFGLNITVNVAPTTATGIFRARVQGMSYTAGSQTGSTDATGRFTYDVGGNVTFKIGNLTLGTAKASPLLFAVDLVPSGTGTTNAVVNIDRFLQMLDKDADQTNGIEVSTPVHAIAVTNNWTVNFDQTGAAFDSDPAVLQIIADANSADGVTSHALPSFANGTAHLKKIYQCAYTGGFIGEYTGANPGFDHGRFGATVKPNGSIEAFGNTLATPSGVGFDSLDPAALHIDQPRSFAVNDVDPPFPLTGNFLTPDTMEGLWQNNTAPAQNGGFSGTRLGPSIDLVASDTTTRHFAGDIELSRDPNEIVTGIIVMDVGQSGGVSGFVYRFVDGNLLTVAGSLDSVSNTFTGTVGNVNATATLTPAGVPVAGDSHPNADFLDGSYSDAQGTAIAFFTDGCRLE